MLLIIIVLPTYRYNNIIKINNSINITYFTIIIIIQQLNYIILINYDLVKTCTGILQVDNNCCMPVSKIYKLFILIYKHK